MDINTSKFITNELAAIAPLPLTTENYPFAFSIQLLAPGSRARTKWLYITPEQLSKIERVLLED